jgi:phosphatidate cytidylyltransferase
MLRRTLTALAIALVGLPAVLLGGPFFFIIISIFLAGAALEYVHMFRSVGFCADETLTVGGVFLLLGLRSFMPEYTVPGLVALVLIAMTIHLIQFERGRNEAALDFAVSAGGLMYIGWIGSYLMDLRNMPDGAWYFLLVMPAVWLGDVGAYAIGAAYGRHKMTPRLSPKKSWEGLWAGIFTSILTGAFFAFAYRTYGPLENITIAQGAVLGLVLGVLTPLGDLGESMFKRQANMKDSSEVLPGHGGFFDRIDSWLWAAPIGYYFIHWFVR